MVRRISGQQEAVGMFPPRLSSRARAPASTATAFDHITVATFVVTAALVFGMVIRFGPNEVVDHIRKVLDGLPTSSRSNVDPEIEARAMYLS